VCGTPAFQNISDRSDSRALSLNGKYANCQKLLSNLRVWHMVTTSNVYNKNRVFPEVI